MRRKEDELRKEHKLPMDPPLRRDGRRRELSAAQIEAGAYQSIMKDD